MRAAYDRFVVDRVKRIVDDWCAADRVRQVCDVLSVTLDTPRP
jgi:hypothetical protein